MALPLRWLDLRLRDPRATRRTRTARSPDVVRVRSPDGLCPGAGPAPVARRLDPRAEGPRLELFRPLDRYAGRETAQEAAGRPAAHPIGARGRLRFLCGGHAARRLIRAPRFASTFSCQTGGLPRYFGKAGTKKALRPSPVHLGAAPDPGESAVTLPFLRGRFGRVRTRSQGRAGSCCRKEKTAQGPEKSQFAEISGWFSRRF